MPHGGWVSIGSASATLVILACSTTLAWGQSSPPPVRVPPDSEPTTWSFSVAAYTYLLPDERNYVQPTVTAERDGGLYLEARYNYENLDTGSAWVGYAFSGGDTLEWEIKPLLGGVFGETTGVAPGYKASLSWRMFEGYSEGEYMFDTGELTDSFFYNWSELTVAPVEWLRAGMVTQRTRAYRSDREIQRGVMIGATLEKFDLTAYVFNPDDSKPTVVVAVSVGW
jgi:hypothetical protein